VTLRKKLTVRQDNHKRIGAVNAGIVIIVCAALVAAVPVAEQNANNDGIDRSVKPGDDFYRYANGSWLQTAVIPAGQGSYDNRLMMRNESAERVVGLLHDAASSHPEKGTITQKVGDYYASVMDEAAIEAKGLSPLADQMATISAISDKRSLSSYIGGTLNSEVEGLIANADHVFGVWINQGFEDSDHNLPHLWQGGLGLPDREMYLDSSPRTADLRAKYQAHIAAVLKVAGFGDTESRAATVLSLETKIAHVFAPETDAADVFKLNNPWKRSDFVIKAPGMNWQAFFASAGLSGQSDFVVWQPSAVTGVSTLVQREALDEWKDYLRFHLIEHYAVVLPKSVAAEGSASTPTADEEPPMPHREDTAIAATNGSLGQAVGQLYAQHYFPPEAKAKAQAMAHDLISAWGTRISNLTWMSPQTKDKALAKLAAFEIGIGYPDQWIDYSTLNIVRGDAFGNMRRAEAFIRRRARY
jgi:predicted metalloendopeptidase